MVSSSSSAPRVRKRRLARSPTRALTTALASTLPQVPGKCNALKENGRRCGLPAGHLTDHRGTGACWIHDDPDRADTIRRYRGIQNRTVYARLRQMNKVERDVLDLVPDIQLVRSVVIDYIERYEELAEAVLSWYKTGRMRPSNVPDLGEAIRALEMISRMVERVHRINSTGAISIDTFRRITEQLGIIVARHVRDGRALEAIEQEWSTVVVEARTRTKALPEVSSETAPATALVPTVPDPAAPPPGAPTLAMTPARKKRKG